MIMILSSLAWAEDPSTVVVKPGQCASAAVDSFLVPRSKMVVLLELADHAKQVPLLQASLVDASRSLDACASELSEAQDALDSMQRQSQLESAELLKLRRQRDVALTVSGIVFVGSAAALVGAFAGH